METISSEDQECITQESSIQAFKVPVGTYVYKSTEIIDSNYE